MANKTGVRVSPPIPEDRKKLVQFIGRLRRRIASLGEALNMAEDRHRETREEFSRYISETNRIRSRESELVRKVNETIEENNILEHFRGCDRKLRKDLFDEQTKYKELQHLLDIERARVGELQAVISKLVSPPRQRHMDSPSSAHWGRNSF